MKLPILFACVFFAVAGANMSAQTSDITEWKNVQYGNADGIPLLMDIAAPEPSPSRPVAAFVMLHGGGWGGGARTDMWSRTQMLAKKGYVAATVEYRLSMKYPFPAQLEDCKAAVRYLRANAAKYGIDPQRIGAWGGSAGGHLVSMLGLTAGMPEFEGTGGNPGVSDAIQMAVDCFGPSDFKTWEATVHKLGGDPEAQKLFGADVPDKNLKWQTGFSLKTDLNLIGLFEGKPDERADWASPVTYAKDHGKTAPPFLIVQGTQDVWVPMQQSVLLADTLDAAGVDVTLMFVPNMGHDESKAFPIILDYLARHFPPAK